MEIKLLKRQIEAGTVAREFFIFECQGSSFIANQYAEAISEIWGLPIHYINSITDIVEEKCNILQGYNVDLEDFSKVDFPVIVICRAYTSRGSMDLSPYKVVFPTVNVWQVYDYVYSMLPGLDSKYIEWLIKACGQDLYRLQNEIDKLQVFSEDSKNQAFLEFKEEGDYSDLLVRPLLNALLSRNPDVLNRVLKNIDLSTVNVNYFCGVLYREFKKRLFAYSEETANKFPYSLAQMLRIFSKLSIIDMYLGQGKYSKEWVVSYLISFIIRGGF